jgi:histidine ammonia-lyase
VTALLLDGNSLTLEDMEAVARAGAKSASSPAARAGVVRARKVVDDAVAHSAVVYGVNTGFGNFADVVIPAPRLRELQLNLVRSHAAGVGDPLTRADARPDAAARERAGQGLQRRAAGDPGPARGHDQRRRASDRAFAGQRGRER